MKKQFNFIRFDNIICEASNCIYYENTRCNAEVVNINSHFSSCETFKCR